MSIHATRYKTRQSWLTLTSSARTWSIGRSTFVSPVSRTSFAPLVSLFWFFALNTPPSSAIIACATLLPIKVYNTPLHQPKNKKNKKQKQWITDNQVYYMDSSEILRFTCDRKKISISPSETTTLISLWDVTVPIASQS